MTSLKWGLVATIKAPTKDVLTFAAYHLDLGADDITIFLDDCNQDTADALASHPKVHCILTDDVYWHTTIGRQPVKHQVRQVRNASFHYRRAKHLDWLAHVDVDEFLCPARPIADILTAVPNDISLLRMPPAETLCTDGQTDLDPKVTYCKAKLPGSSEGQRLEQVFYPNFGGVLKSGFVSHVVGKVFARTGHQNVKFGIHRAFENQTDDLPELPSADIELCHQHIESWEKWLEVMSFRLQRGSYRAELEQSLNPLSGRIQRHKLFKSLMEDGSKDLRAFFDEVCSATPRLREVLDSHGYLRRYELDLKGKLSKHFPQFA